MTARKAVKKEGIETGVDKDEQLRKDLFIALAPQINIDYPRPHTQKLLKAIDEIIDVVNRG